MTTRSCPDWPSLMEIAPELQFKHYTLREAQSQLPTEVLVQLDVVASDDEAICCDLENHVFNADHTELHVAEALRASHWFDLRDWHPPPSGDVTA
jgi:hypothetical protein